jgi:hypothetical protein
MTLFIRFDTTARSAAGEQVPLRLDPVRSPQHVVVHILEVGNRLVADAGGLTAEQCRQHLAQRRDHTTEVDHDPTEVEHLPWDVVARGRREHDLLDVVEAIVEAVGDIEVPVDDDVEKRPDQETFVVRRLARAFDLEAVDHGVELERRRVVGVVAALTDRQHPAVSEHDVDLASTS